MERLSEFNPPKRVLMGPGPSDVDPRVLRAMSASLLGHLDPDFLAIMNEVKELLQCVFQTKNPLTLAVSGTGTAGMETCLCNLIEHGDPVLVCVNGFFGDRMCEIVGRCGGVLHRLDAPWGRIVDTDAVAEAVRKVKPKVVAIVHAETSTGVLQPLEEISEIVHGSGALLLVDAVTSLGGCPVKLDEWKIDACYSGTQKCLSCPPGLSPVSFNDAGVQAIQNRTSKVQSFYLDMSVVMKYWGQERAYHHTAPISLNYAIREALRLVLEEGLEARFARHERNHRALVAGLEAMGLKMFAQEGHRLWMLNTVGIPDGVHDLAARTQLLHDFGIEIGGGLGDLKGKIWRIGLMGYSCNRQNVFLVLTALSQALAAQGKSVPVGDGLAAASAVYRE